MANLRIGQMSLKLGLLVLGSLALAGSGALAEQPSPGAEEQVPVMKRPIFLNIPQDLMHLSNSWETGKLLLRIGPDGSVMDWIPLDLPHPKLIDPIDRALKGAEFTPPVFDGESVVVDIPATIPLHNLDGFTVISQSISEHIESRMATLNPNLFQLVVTPPAELDQPLRLVSHGDSYNVMDEQGRALSGKVLVEFYIDPDGYPRMIRPLEDADPVLSQAAVMTVSNMRFTPPRHAGRLTVTKARIPVILGE